MRKLNSYQRSIEERIYVGGGGENFFLHIPFKE